MQVPGKIMLFGEYAVLDGALAVLTPVDRFVTCNVDPGGPEPPLVRQLLPQGEREFEPIASHLQAQFEGIKGRYLLDMRAFFDASGKLGLGSSAAGTVALARAFFEASHRTPSLEELFLTAQRAHRAAQGVGSGADIAVCCLQKLCAYRWDESNFYGQFNELEDVGHLLDDVWAVVTQKPANTPSLVKQMKLYAQAHPQIYARHMQAISDASEMGCNALKTNDFYMLQRAVYRGREALIALSKDAQIPVWSEVHQQVAQVLDPLGVPFKPTGAGVGDLIWILPQKNEAKLALKALTAAHFPSLRFKKTVCF